MISPPTVGNRRLIGERGEVMHYAVASLVGLGAACGVILIFVVSDRQWRQRNTKKLRTTVVLSAAALAFVGLTSAAQASTTQNTGMVYRSAAGCTEAHVYLNNTSGDPHMDSQTTSIGAENEPNYGVCDSNNTYALYSGGIAVQQTLYHWNGSTWVACSVGAFYYNQTKTAHSTTAYNFTHTCGTGYYTGVSTGDVYNGGWQGGPISAPGYVTAS
jgi:hypothetical protein